MQRFLRRGRKEPHVEAVVTFEVNYATSSRVDGMHRDSLTKQSLVASSSCSIVIGDGEGSIGEYGVPLRSF